MRRRQFIAFAGSAVVAWPIATPAQQAEKIPTVGILWHAGNPEEEGVLYRAMHDGFTALGYVTGGDGILEERFPGEIEGRFERFANELVALNVNVFVAVGARRFWPHKRPPKQSQSFSYRPRTRSRSSCLQILPGPIAI